MAPHVMLSYQWDIQELVKRVYDCLKEGGLSVWMDVEGGVSGNINDALVGKVADSFSQKEELKITSDHSFVENRFKLWEASLSAILSSGVEEAAVICPFMTPEYQASRSAKKELNYADTRGVTIVPVMVAQDWEPTEWLGLITAGLLWIDFRNAEKSEDHFEKCIKSLADEIMFCVGNLLTEEAPPLDVNDGPVERPASVRRKQGRGFRHALTGLYLCESGEEKFQPESDIKNTVELHDCPGDNGYWEEIKGENCKHYRSYITSGYLGYDPNEGYTYTTASPHEEEEWQLMVDGTNCGPERAVFMKNKNSQSYLAVQEGKLTGMECYDESCKWFLE